MITKFARLEFELFTKPSKSDFLRVHQCYSSDNGLQKGCNNNFHAYLYYLDFVSIEVTRHTDGGVKRGSTPREPAHKKRI